MKNLTNEEMAEIQGGGLLNAVQGFCTGVAIVAGANWIGLIALSATGLWFAGAIGIACLAIEVAKRV